MREILSGYLLWTLAGGVCLGLTAWTLLVVGAYLILSRWRR